MNSRQRHRRPYSGELPRWQRWSVYGAGALLLVSGLLWLVFHYSMSVQTQFGPRPHPLEYFWLRLHGAAAMLGLLALGSLVPMHVQRAWQQRKNRATGLVAVAASLLLILTGYLLYYFATEGSRAWLGALHWGVGLAALPALIWHVLAGLRLRQLGQREPRPLSSHSKPELAPHDARLH